MSLCLLFTRRLRIVDDGNKPVPIVPNIKNYVAVHRIGILEHGTNFVHVVPPGCFNDTDPCFDFVRRIRVIFNRFAQMLTRNDMHQSRILHIL